MGTTGQSNDRRGNEKQKGKSQAHYEYPLPEAYLSVRHPQKVSRALAPAPKGVNQL